jgi:outer membrane protein assembly factor BamA
LLSCLSFGPGDTVTQTILTQNKDRLVNLNIFKNVIFQPYRDETGTIKLIIVIEESLNILPIPNLEYNEVLYGFKKIWFNASLDTYFNNFRGRREILIVRTELWDKRSFGLSWSQPVFSYPGPFSYWMRGQGGIAAQKYRPYRTRYAFSEVGTRKKLSDRITGSVLLNYYLTTEDSIPIVTDFDTSSTGVITTHKSLEDIFITVQKYRFPTFGIGLAYDCRDNLFPSRKGWRLSGLMLNYGLPNNALLNFREAQIELSGYIPVIFVPHTVAFYSQAKIRDSESPEFMAMFGGGEGSVRGYREGSFKGDRVVENSIEYRIPIYLTPEIKIPIVYMITPQLNNIRYRIEGALFTDFGSYWDIGTRPDKVYSGHGAGIRVYMFPLKRSAALDIAWSREGLPHLHAYIDIRF